MNKKISDQSKLTQTCVESSSGLSQEVEDQFELELCWCVQQLEMCLFTGKLPEKQMHDLKRNINILKSNNASLIKKRQIMRNTLGNYREKMALDEQKFGKTAFSIKFMPTTNKNKKSIFLRKAASTSSSTSLKEKQYLKTIALYSNSNENIDANDVQNPFKFNFQIE